MAESKKRKLTQEEKEELVAKGKNTQFKSGAQAAAAGRKGGIRSQQVQKAKKNLQQTCRAALDTEVISPRGEKMTIREVITNKLTKMASEGGLKAIEMLAKLSGEWPDNSIVLKTEDIPTIIDDLAPEGAKRAGKIK